MDVVAPPKELAEDSASDPVTEVTSGGLEH